MKTVILGAGASYDLYNKFHDEDGLHEGHDWRPPLGNDILGSNENFRKIYNRYPGAKYFAGKVNTVNDVEAYFQNQWELANKFNDINTLRNLINFQYCLQHLFYEISENYSDNLGANNYDILLQDAHEYHLKTKEEVAFITFNYDILLEKAYMKLYGLKEMSINHYISNPIKIFKPHGSCSWFKRFTKKTIDGTLPHEKLYVNRIDNIKVYDLLENQIICTTEPLVKKGNRNWLDFKIYWSNDTYDVFPQLLIPLKTKDEFIMPEDHEMEMRQHLSNTNDILIIGWKGQEEHFTKCLKSEIGNKEVDVSLVVLNDRDLQSIITKCIERAKITNFDKGMGYDPNSQTHIYEKYHEAGTFSSYILNVIKGVEGEYEKNFFDA